MCETEAALRSAGSGLVVWSCRLSSQGSVWGCALFALQSRAAANVSRADLLEPSPEEERHFWKVWVFFSSSAPYFTIAPNTGMFIYNRELCWLYVALAHERIRYLRAKILPHLEHQSKKFCLSMCVTIWASAWAENMQTVCVYMSTWECVEERVCECVRRVPSFLIQSSERHLSGHRTVIHCLTAVFCEPALLGSWGVIPHTGPAGDFPAKKRKKKKARSPVLTHPPANSTSRASLVQESKRVGFTDFWLCIHLFHIQNT